MCPESLSSAIGHVVTAPFMEMFNSKLFSMALLQQSHAVQLGLGRALRAMCLNASFITECLWLDGFDNQMLMGRGDKR